MKMDKSLKASIGLQFIRVAIVVLDDQHGISDEAWIALQHQLDHFGAGEMIEQQVKCTDGRFYLPEDTAEKLRKTYGLPTAEEILQNEK